MTNSFTQPLLPHHHRWEPRSFKWCSTLSLTNTYIQPPLIHSSGGIHWSKCCVILFPGNTMLFFFWLQYGVVLDAGSSHTELFVYQWATGRVIDGTALVEQIGHCKGSGTLCVIRKQWHVTNITNLTDNMNLNPILIAYSEIDDWWVQCICQS